MLAKLMLRPGMLAIVMALAFGNIGCSWGSVTDKATGAGLGGAYIKVNQVDFSTAMGSSGPIVKSVDFQTSNTWSPAMRGSNGADGLWYLNLYGLTNSGDNKVTFLPSGWNRFYVLQTGYDARVFFRDHEYNQSCPIFGNKNPYSAGAYPYDISGESSSGTCVNESFQLNSASQNYVKDPDMMVDPRTLLDNVYATIRGAAGETFSSGGWACEGKFDSCIRVSVGTPNVGVGDLWVTAPATSFATVTQHRFNRNSGMTDTAIPGSFTQDDHPHLHFKHWTEIRLRKIDSTCEYPSSATNCPVLPTTGSKVSFCLTETVSSFDSSSVAVVYQPNQHYGCTNDGVTISQGIGSSRADVYTKGLTGQMIGTDGLHGDFWLEVEVNPPDSNGVRAVIESDYSNNASRVKVTIP
jgi:Lysyl oxidase